MVNRVKKLDIILDIDAMTRVPFGAERVLVHQGRLYRVVVDSLPQSENGAYCDVTFRLETRNGLADSARIIASAKGEIISAEGAGLVELLSSARWIKKW